MPELDHFDAIDLDTRWPIWLISCMSRSQMSSLENTRQARSGIAGLDLLLQGGWPADRLHLVEGEPGTGKTTLALQFLLQGREQGERGLYVTLSESLEELRHVAGSHGWTLDGIDLHELGAIGETPDDDYTLYHPAEIELGSLTKAVLERVEATKPSRVVFDSLSELRLLAREPLRYRRQILGLKEFFSHYHSTVLLLDDHSAGESDLQLRSLAHGVLMLEHLPFDYGRTRRRLRIVKLRGRAATEGFHDFIIARGGLTVFPQLEPNGTSAPRSPIPVASGVSELDALLGGGLTWGTTTLFIGPAGVGKSTVSAQYLCGAANPRAKAAVFLFDERQATFVARCDALGMHASERIAGGHLVVQQVEPGTTSPGEFAARISRLVEFDGVRLIGIDTLNGYLNAIPSSEGAVTRMHELLSYLNEHGVATLIVLSQYGIVGSVMPVPIDLSYLADAIVLFRFFEASGEVRKAISCVKKRTGWHEHTIRELKLADEGVLLGAPLTDFRGILTGVPEYTGAPAPLLSDDKPRASR
jgi:circadian clock protein KaiC